ncbi:MAG: tetratricopeptide repeat protein, partial [Acidobacteria bacterium]|nr:tetratricopeptide repeat protein [Acidobacteriota bacterium]
MFAKFSYFLLASFLIATGMLQSAEAQGEPLSYSEIITVLNTKGKDPKNGSNAINFLIKEIKSRSVNAPMSNDIEKLLIESGATPVLFASIKESLRPDPNGNAAAYFESGNKFFKNKKFDRAIIEYTKAIKLDPILTRAQVNRGRAYEENKDVSNAYQDYSEVIECPGEIGDEELIELLFRRASLQYDFAHQNVDYSEIISRDPKNIKAYLERGNNLMLENHYTGARADFDMVVRIEPKNVDSYLARAEFLYKISEWKDAIADWKRILQIDPNNEIAKSNLSGRLKDEEEGLNDI